MLSRTVMSLFVLQRPGNQCHQYRVRSTSASHEIVANSPSLGYDTAPSGPWSSSSSAYAYNRCSQIQPGKPASSYFYTIS
eukprot:IDg22846t1